MNLYQQIKAQSPKIARGLVWCRTCRREITVDPVRCLRAGWPTCCGATMTIDPPHEWDGENHHNRREP